MRIRESSNTVWAVFKRELAGYFTSPVAYVFIVIFLMLLGFFTFYISRFFESGQADLRGFFEWHPWVFLFLVPAAAMRLWADERRLGTMELMLTLPVTAGEAILAKFLAAWVFLGICLLLTFPTVATVVYLGNPDMGAVLCGYLGSFLMAGAFLSIGSMTSAMTRSQVISFIISVVICLFFILAGYPPVTEVFSGWAPSWLVAFISRLGFLPHFTSIKRGVVDFRDIAYFLSVTAFMLSANGVILQNRRTA
jgi:ABC-2 type transport system permease protein